MGCRIAKNEPEGNPVHTTNNMQQSSASNKSKFERKMYLARETPEPEFDISDCGLREIPSGIFVICRVLRKERLLLHGNQLNTLKGGGLLLDLTLIRVLDLRQNRFKKLPEELGDLVELRELFLSDNQLESVPKTINKLQKLEILDVTHNNLSTLESIAFLASLRILNVSQNPKLTTLPATLATCESLIDLVVDFEAIQEPPLKVLELGTRATLDYLMGNLRPDEIDARRITVVSETDSSKRFIEYERGFVETTDVYLKGQKDVAKTNQLLEAERQALEKDYLIEAELHSQQQKKRQELLREIQEQQQVQESQLNQLNIEKTQNRDNLIRNIIESEERWKKLVEQSIEWKPFVADPLLLEREAKEQDRLLEQLKLQQDDLRKQEILQAMQGLLENELNQVDLYQKQRDLSSKNVLTKESENNLLLMDVFLDYDKNKSQMVEQIHQDESVQKSAVATLIAKNDARSWALVEQMRIVENQLVAMSVFEIEKRKEFSAQQFNELAERRSNLTVILMELLDQQDLRKKELLDTLGRIESERDDRKDFWLLQYQRLLDSQPENIEFGTEIDPVLGYNFLINNVVHCLPFLSRLWQDKSIELHEITEKDLVGAGIRIAVDREGILKSIAQFLESENKLNPMPLEKAVEAKEVETALEEEDRRVDSEEQLAECVICMDEKVKIIFLLCGHLACCDNCHESVDICPMCRAPIQQRIRVIQA